MPDQISSPAPAPPQAPSAPAGDAITSPQRGPTINIADEFGTAKRNLPPAKPLLLTAAVILILAASALADLTPITFLLGRRNWE